MTVEVAEATGKLEEKVSEEGLIWTFFFCPIFVNSILIFTNYYKGCNPADIVKCPGEFFP
jgi:hypothetical protein